MASRALYKAVIAGRLKQSRLLIEAGAPMEYHEKCGQTVLIKAVLLDDDKTRIKMVHLLLEKGACTEHMDSLNRTALSWACMLGREPEVTFILEFNNDLNAPDINGQTALYHAVTSGNVAVVKKVVLALRKFDLSVDISDNNGTSPLMQAIRLGHDLCASVLTIHGGAKVGKTMNYPDDFISARKWATRSLRYRDGLNSRKDQFPPIHANKAFVTMKCTATSPSKGRTSIRKTGMRSQSKNVKFAQNSDSDASDDEFSSDAFEEYLYSSEIPNKCLNYMPLSTFVHAESPETCDSTISLSSVVDEVDAHSTVIETKKLVKHEDLSRMFNIIQDQLSPSYRDTVGNVREDAFQVSLSSDNCSCSSNRRKRLQTGQKNCQLDREISLLDSLVEAEAVNAETNSSSLRADQKTCFPILPLKMNLIQTKLNGRLH